MKIKLSISKTNELVVDYNVSHTNVATKKLEKFENVDASQTFLTQLHRRSKHSPQFQSGEPRLVSPFEYLI